MKVNFLEGTSDGSQEVIATLALKSGVIIIESGNNELVEEYCFLEKKYFALLGKEIDPNVSPEEYLRALPYYYNNAYMRAEVVE